MTAYLAPPLLLLLAVLKLGLCLLLVAAAMHLLRLGLWSLRQSAPARLPTAPPLSDHPVVTVQLPMYNERTVAARAIAAACALDWPALRVQVLDDSTDDTRELIDGLVADARARGHDIVVLRRPDRRGSAGPVPDPACSPLCSAQFALAVPRHPPGCHPAGRTRVP